MFNGEQLELREFARVGNSKGLSALLARCKKTMQYDTMSTILNNSAPIQDPKSGKIIEKSAFVIALINENITCAEMLHEAGSDAFKIDELGRTALHWAAFHDKQKSVKFLLSLHVEQMARDLEGQTALMLTTTNSSTKNAAAMLKNHAHPPFLIDLADVRGMSSLFWAAYNGSYEHVKLFIKHGASREIIDLEGKAALHWGVAGGSIEIAKILFNKEIVNVQDRDMRTCLHIAAGSKDLSMTSFLLSNAECNECIQDDLMRTPLHWAAQVCAADVIREMLRLRGADQFFIVDINNSSALHYAAQQNDATCIHALLSNPQVHDFQDAKGKSALMWACLSQNVGVVQAMTAKQYLLSNQVKSLKDETGASELHAAAYSGNAPICSALLEAAFPIDEKDNDELTPLFFACEQGHVEAVNVLLDHSASVSIADKEGRSPLHFATSCGFGDVCELLMTKGRADPNLGDHGQRTALHTAAYVGTSECIRVLLDFGANIDQQDGEGMTALIWAASQGFLDCVKELASSQANLNIYEFGPERLTAYDFAVSAGHSKVAAWLKSQGALSTEELRHLAAEQIQATLAAHQFRSLFQDEWQKLNKPKVQLPPEPKQVPVIQADPIKSRLSMAHGLNAKDTGVKLPSIQSPKPKEKRPTLPHNVSPTRSKRNSPVPAKKESIKPEPVPPVVKRPKTPQPARVATPPARVATPPPRIATPPPRIATPPREPTPPPREPTPPAYPPREHTPPKRESVKRRPPTPPREPTPPVVERSPEPPQVPIDEGNRIRARRERERQSILRRKIEAAVVIQRAYRSYLFRKNLPNAYRDVPGPKPTHPSMKQLLQPKGTGEATRQEQEIAALVIQLAWRQYTRRNLKSRIETQINNRSQVIRSYLEEARRKRQELAYRTSVPQVIDWKPQLKPAERTLVELPSPAVTSFNMAVSIYRTNCGLEDPSALDPTQLLQSVNERLASLKLTFPKMHASFPTSRPDASLVSPAPRFEPMKLNSAYRRSHKHPLSNSQNAAL